jgi:hypothetical protein
MLGGAYQIPVSFKTWGVQKKPSFNHSQIKKLAALSEFKRERERVFKTPN